MLPRIAGFVLFTALGLLADSGAGLHWTAPSGWKAQGSRPMRLNTYVVGGEAECGVFYFGTGQGGSVQANLDRWIGQFQQQPYPAKVLHILVHGLKVTKVDASGSYTGMGGPMASGGAPKPGYRLLGAIAEGPEGTVFFKFTGPAKTAGAQASAFEKMIQSLQK